MVNWGELINVFPPDIPTFGNERLWFAGSLGSRASQVDRTGGNPLLFTLVSPVPPDRQVLAPLNLPA